MRHPAIEERWLHDSAVATGPIHERLHGTTGQMVNRDQGQGLTGKLGPVEYVTLTIGYHLVALR
jgi:hypothetical protein